MIQGFTKKERLEKINHLTTPQIHLVTLWRGTLDYITVNKVAKTSSISTSYNSNTLLIH